jgi:hypothetical protein
MPFMAESDEGPAADDPPRQPQSLGPAKASSTAVLVREADRMRTGMEAAVLDVSTGFLSLRTRGTFALDEQVKVRLRNIVQRFEKEARGTVRKAESGEDGSTIVEIDLLTRLSPLEVSLLKMGIASPQSGSGSKWV